MLIRRGIAPVIGRVTMAWRRRVVRAHAFAQAHPVLAARLARWADVARAGWARLSAPVRALRAAVGRRVAGGIAAARTGLARAAGAAVALAVRGWRRLLGQPAPAMAEVPVDLNPSTVEPVRVGAGGPNSNGAGSVGRRDDEAHGDSAGRLDVPFGNGWWNG